MMSSDFYSRDDLVERGSIPLDIDNVHMLLQGQCPLHLSLLFFFLEYLKDMHVLLWSQFEVVAATMMYVRKNSS